MSSAQIPVKYGLVPFPSSRRSARSFDRVLFVVYVLPRELWKSNGTLWKEGGKSFPSNLICSQITKAKNNVYRTMQIPVFIPEGG